MVRAAFAAIVLASAPMADAGARAASPDTTAFVTPEVLLSHIAANRPEQSAHPRFFWLDGGRRILVSVATPQAQEGAGTGEFSSYIPLSFLQQTIDLETGAVTDVGRGYDPGVAANANVVAYHPEGSDRSRLVMARPGDSRSCEISASDLMQDATGFEAFALTAEGDQIVVAVGFGASRFAQAGVATVEGAAVRVMGSTAPQPSGHHVALWRLNDRCAEPMRIAEVQEARIGRLAWTDQNRQVMAVTVSPEPYRILPRSDLRIVDVDTGQQRILVGNIGGQGAGVLQPAPHAPLVAFSYDPEGLGYPIRKQFAVASTVDGRLLAVSADPRERPQWLDDQTVLADISGGHPLTRRPVTLDVISREAELGGFPANAIPSPDRHRLAWLNIDLYGAATLSIADLHRNGAGAGWRADNRREVWRAESPLSSYARAERRFVRCESSDGVRPDAILVLPIGYDARRRYPLIVDLHGGPRGGLDGGSDTPYTPGTVLVSSTLEHDMWATKGYAVLVADYRASGMYGFDAVSRTGEAFAQDFDDIMCNVDAVIRDGVADSERLAVIGHSYGGFEVNWIVTHSSRFKAAISKEGGFGVDMLAQWGANGMVNAQSTTLYGSPIDNPEPYRRMSPINFTRGVTTPTMFVTHRGGGRPADLYGWMFTAWREQGVDAQYRIYDDPNHVLGGEADQRDQLEAAIAWIDRRLGVSPSGAEGREP